MRTRLFFALLLLAVALSAGVVQAQGVIVDPQLSPMPPVDDGPQPAPLVLPGPVRIKLHRVDTRIVDQVATTHIEQIFVNETRFDLEGTYLFPMPEQAAISEFNMFVDGQKIEGQIMRKEEARRIYEDIVRQRRDPALLEYVGRDLFQARIFPIPPGGERKIELTYSQVLPLDNGLIHYRYPLRTDRFLSKDPVRGSGQPADQLAISVSIESKSPLKAIYSPSHNVVVARDGDYKAQVGFEQTNALPASDFDLYYSVDEGEIGVSLLSYKPAGEDGFFLLLAAPNVEVDEAQVVARDVLLVLDTSGSMQGQKIEQARSALLYVLERLNPEDRFNIVSFSTGVRQFERGLQPMSQLQAAKGFVSRLEAAGGTDINRALLEALVQVEAGRPTVIIFLTDGLPTEGEVDPQRIIANVRQNAKPNVQIFSFGVGDDVNTVLLDSISQENGGASAYVRPNQSIDEIVSGFFAKVSTPVLSGMRLDFGQTFAEDLYPYPLPDLFAGTQIVLTGRYRGGGPATITLSGTVNGQEKRFTFEDLTLHSEGGEPFIARLWATRKIGYLLNQIRLQGQSRELVDEIVRLSTTYGIATPYTSYFVPEPQIAVQPPPMPQDSGGGPMATAIPAPSLLDWLFGRPAVPVPAAVPAEQPAAAEVVEVEQEVAKAVERSAQSLGAASQSGAEAVAESQAREALRSADSVAGEAAGGLRYATDKSFVYQAGLWVDTAYKTDLPKRELAFGSAEYFDLLAQHPEWNGYFAVSPNLIVVLEGTAYVVTDTGQPIAAALTTSGPTQSRPTSPSATSTHDLAQNPPPTPTTTLAPGATRPPTPVNVGPVGPVRNPPPSPFCAGPAIGLGLLLVPGLWAWQRRR